MIAPDPYAPTLSKAHYADLCENLEAQVESLQELNTALQDRVASYAYIIAEMTRKLAAELAHGSEDDEALVAAMVANFGEDGVLEELGILEGNVLFPGNEEG